MALLIIGLVVLTAVVLVRVWPEATRRWFRRVLTARRIIFGTAAVITALLFISSGATGLVIIGSLILLFAVLFVIFSDSTEVLSRWLPDV
jgi:Ca2+/Na+ antiporter